MTPNQNYLNLREAAEYLGIGESTAQRLWPSWIKLGIIPARYPGKRLRFKKSDLDKLIEQFKVAEV